MPPKKKKAKQPQRPPETADEYLAEAVFQEESAEKWRAGDAQKAARFYSRALGIYDEALKLFPSSIDLAYNKARIQYEITQWPAVCSEFSASPVALLEAAVESHREALVLKPDEAPDLMFNTAQVLTSLAEVIDNDSSERLLLREAVSLFQECLKRQELLLEHSLAQIKQGDEALQEQDNTDQGDGGISLQNAQQNPLPPQDVQGAEEETDSSPSYQWATIVDPVTYVTLLETCEAFFSALATLSKLLTSPNELDTLQPVTTALLNNKIPTYLAHVSTTDSKETIQDLAFEVLSYYAAIADAQFRLKVTSFEDYDATLKQIFSPPQQQELAAIIQILDPQEPAYLTRQADALVTFTTSTSKVQGKATLRYTRLSKALDCLTEAAKHPARRGVASIHLERGDAEMLRFQVTKSGELPEDLSNTNVQQTLLENAATYYRGAVSVVQSGSVSGGSGSGGGARGSMREQSVALEASIKQAVVKAMLGDNNAALAQLTAEGVSPKEMGRVSGEMVADALITEEELERI